MESWGILLLNLILLAWSILFGGLPVLATLQRDLQGKFLLVLGLMIGLMALSGALQEAQFELQSRITPAATEDPSSTPTAIPPSTPTDPADLTQAWQRQACPLIVVARDGKTNLKVNGQVVELVVGQAYQMVSGANLTLFANAQADVVVDGKSVYRFYAPYVERGEVTIDEWDGARKITLHRGAVSVMQNGSENCTVSLNVQTVKLTGAASSEYAVVVPTDQSQAAQVIHLAGELKAIDKSGQEQRFSAPASLSIQKAEITQNEVVPPGSAEDIRRRLSRGLDFSVEANNFKDHFRISQKVASQARAIDPLDFRKPWGDQRCRMVLIPRSGEVRVEYEQHWSDPLEIGQPFMLIPGSHIRTIGSKNGEEAAVIAVDGGEIVQLFRSEQSAVVADVRQAENRPQLSIAEGNARFYTGRQASCSLDVQVGDVEIASDAGNFGVYVPPASDADRRPQALAFGGAISVTFALSPMQVLSATESTFMGANLLAQGISVQEVKADTPGCRAAELQARLTQGGDLLGCGERGTWGIASLFRALAPIAPWFLAAIIAFLLLNWFTSVLALIWRARRSHLRREWSALVFAIFFYPLVYGIILLPAMIVGVLTPAVSVILMSPVVLVALVALAIVLGVPRLQAITQPWFDRFHRRLSNFLIAAPIQPLIRFQELRGRVAARLILFLGRRVKASFIRHSWVLNFIRPNDRFIFLLGIATDATVSDELRTQALSQLRQLQRLDDLFEIACDPLGTPATRLEAASQLNRAEGQAPYRSIEAYECIADQTDLDIFARLEAMSRLGRIPTQQAAGMNRLTQILRDATLADAVRIEAARRLAEFGPHPVAQQMLHALLRGQAGRLRPVPPARHAVRRSRVLPIAYLDGRTVLAAARALARLPSPNPQQPNLNIETAGNTIFRFIVPSLAAGNGKLCQEAVWLIGEIGCEDLLAQLATMPNVPLELQADAIRCLELLGFDQMAADCWLALAQRPTERREARILAAEAATTLGNPEASPILLSLGRSIMRGQERTCYAAAVALYWQGEYVKAMAIFMNLANSRQADATTAQLAEGALALFPA